MAHVRAASKGTGISQQNCHPFKAGRLLFCHNGRLHQFAEYRRKFTTQIHDDVYNNIHGNTDSEIVFHLILTNLMMTAKEEEHGCEGDHVNPLHQKTPFGAKRLVTAIKQSLHQIEAFYDKLGLPQEDNVYNTCNFSLTDGETMVATRYCDKANTIPPPSLYFAYGTAQSLYYELTHEEVSAAQVSPLSSPPPPPPPPPQAPALVASETSEFTNDAVTTTSDDDEEDSHHNSHHNTTTSTSTSSTTSDNDEDGEDSWWVERRIALEQRLSRPGKVMVDVNPVRATFIVASNPLTKTHTWHPMPRNSIMWCTRGQHPELHKLMKRHVDTPRPTGGTSGTTGTLKKKSCCPAAQE
jgi:predicted glutamine amidotransferase